MRHPLTFLTVAAFSAPALADGTATWLWDVTTQNGDAIVEPGETATVTLSLLMEPDAGFGPFVAISATVFDVLGDGAAAKGHILGWDYHGHLADLTGDLATSDGVSIYNVQAGQITTFGGPFSSDNPIDVFTFEWAPVEDGPFNATYNTDSVYEGHLFHEVYVWEGEDKDSAQAVIYPVAEAAISITVVPAPPAALLALAGMLTQRRRT